MATNPIQRACEIIEAGDARLLALDGPCGNLPPILSLAEWRELYTLLDSARSALDAKDAELKRLCPRGWNGNDALRAFGQLDEAREELDEAKRREDAWRAFSYHLAICMQCGEGSSLLCMNAVRLHEAAVRSAVSRGEADNG